MNGVFAKPTAVSVGEAAKVIPRAEFRVFGHGIIKTVQKKMWDAGAILQRARKMPAEIYFLSTHTNDANVKVRGGLLDIKTKIGKTPEGYEIFQPRGKFKFPVKKEDLSIILQYLDVKLDLDRKTCGFEEFTKMGAPSPRPGACDGREDALWLHDRWGHLRIRASVVQWSAPGVCLLRER